MEVEVVVVFGGVGRMDGWFRRTLAIGEPVSRHVGGLSMRDVGVREVSLLYPTCM